MSGTTYKPATVSTAKLILAAARENSREVGPAVAKAVAEALDGGARQRAADLKALTPALFAALKDGMAGVDSTEVPDALASAARAVVSGFGAAIDEGVKRIVVAQAEAADKVVEAQAEATRALVEAHEKLNKQTGDLAAAVAQLVAVGMAGLDAPKGEGPRAIFFVRDKSGAIVSARVEPTR